jgi:hypothetical protein
MPITGDMARQGICERAAASLRHLKDAIMAGLCLNNRGVAVTLQWVLGHGSHGSSRAPREEYDTLKRLLTNAER